MQEARAWTIRRGTAAAQAAGVIHSDFEKRFIKADAIAWHLLVKAGSHRAAAEQGLIRTEGRDYEVQDGDVLLFKHNA